MIRVELVTKRSRRMTAVDDLAFTRLAGPGHRLPRPERRR